MIKFIKTNTNKDEVFGTVKFIKYIDIIAERSLFTGNGFPFNERFFEKHQEKRELFYGKNTNIYEEINDNIIFSKLNPIDFKNISIKHKLDYIIIDKKNENSSFLKYKPFYENKKVKIFRVNDLSI